MKTIGLAVVGFLVTVSVGSALAQSRLLDIYRDKPLPLDAMGVLRDTNNLISDKQLRTYCTAPPEDRANASFCLAYILGVVDSFQSSLAFQKNTDGVDQSKIEMCFSIPAGTSGFQVRDVVIKALQAQKKDDLEFPASWAVGYALKKAFPCK
jgi:hypothetical protein